MAQCVHPRGGGRLAAAYGAKVPNVIIRQPLCPWMHAGTGLEAVCDVRDVRDVSAVRSAVGLM